MQHWKRRFLAGLIGFSVLIGSLLFHAAVLELWSGAVMLLGALVAIRINTPAQRVLDDYTDELERRGLLDKPRDAEP